MTQRHLDDCGLIADYLSAGEPEEGDMTTITITQFRQKPGWFVHRVSRHAESFLVTVNGYPAMRLVPAEEDTTIMPDGTFTGPRPLTMAEKFGAEWWSCCAREASHG